jgi:hypothetical protein
VLNKLSRLLDEAGISLTDHQKNQLVAYVEMLHKWNKAYNLTSVRDPNEMLIRHILDSIVVAPHLQGSGLSMSERGQACRGSRYLLFFLMHTSPCWIAWVNASVFCARFSMSFIAEHHSRTEPRRRFSGRAAF